MINPFLHKSKFEESIEKLKTNQIKARLRSAKIRLSKLGRVKDFQTRYEKGGFNCFSSTACNIDSCREKIIILEKELKKRGEDDFK